MGHTIRFLHSVKINSNFNTRKMYIFLFALCTSWAFVGVSSECPNLNDLPVLNDAGDEFYCAFYWQEWGDEEPIRGCNGEEYSVMDNTDHDAADGYYYATGS